MMTRETRERLLVLQSAIRDAENRVEQNTFGGVPMKGQQAYVREQQRKMEVWDKEIMDLGGEIRLYIVHVTTTLENDFEAGCHLAVEAQSMAGARNRAWQIEADAVGSADGPDSYRVTETGQIDLVPAECEEFIRSVFEVHELPIQEVQNGETKGA